MNVRLLWKIAKNAIEKEKNAVWRKMNSCEQIFLRAISHDLRTPLCSISGNADMLLNNGRAWTVKRSIRFMWIFMMILNGSLAW